VEGKSEDLEIWCEKITNCFHENTFGLGAWSRNLSFPTKNQYCYSQSSRRSLIVLL